MDKRNYNIPMPKLHLELGDWVTAKIGENDNKVTPSMYVVGLFGDTVYLEIDAEQGDPFEELLSDITPIPITKEILDANGLSEWFSAYKCGSDVAVISKGIVDGCNRQIPVRYVHELQHFMRIYGISRQILL